MENNNRSKKRRYNRVLLQAQLNNKPGTQDHAVIQMYNNLQKNSGLSQKAIVMLGIIALTEVNFPELLERYPQPVNNAALQDMQNRIQEIQTMLTTIRLTGSISDETRVTLDTMESDIADTRAIFEDNYGEIEVYE